MRSLLASFVALASFTVASSAFAQDDAIITPAPGQAAASAPAPSAVPITATCSLGEHEGIADAEARTAADVICHELAKRGATNTNHEVRIGKLGGRTLITLAARNGNTYDEVRTFVNGLDELDVAAPRMAASLVEHKPMAETRTVDTVLADEQRAPKVQRGLVACELGMYGMSSLGQSSAAAAGFAVGIGYRAGDWGIIGSGHLGGIGSDDRKITSALFDMGGRYYLGEGDVAPFVGAGMEVSYFNIGGNDGSGLGAYGTLGVEMLRSHHMGLVAAARVDAPFYAIGSGAQYTAPVSLEVAMVFH